MFEEKLKLMHKTVEQASTQNKKLHETVVSQTEKIRNYEQELEINKANIDKIHLERDQDG